MLCLSVSSRQYVYFYKYILMYNGRNKLLGEKENRHYIGKASHPHTNNKAGALSLTVPCFHLVDPVHSNRDDVVLTFPLGKSVTQQTVPALCLP